MAEILKIVPGGFSFVEKEGFNLVPTKTLGRFFEHIRAEGTDLYVIKYYKASGEAIELTRGYVPAGPIERFADLRYSQKELEKTLDREANFALEYITNEGKIHSVREKNHSMVYIKCSDGIIGCGWYDHADSDTDKGLKLAAFYLYALGLFNVKNDTTLWKAAYHHLSGSTILMTGEYRDVVDMIIFDSIKDDIIKANNQPTTFRIVDEP